MAERPVTDAMVEIGAKAITPYAWNDAFWRDDPRRAPQFERNQRHAQECARRDARACLEAVFRATPDTGEGR